MEHETAREIIFTKHIQEVQLGQLLSVTLSNLSYLRPANQSKTSFATRLTHKWKCGTHGVVVTKFGFSYGVSYHVAIIQPMLQARPGQAELSTLCRWYCINLSYCVLHFWPVITVFNDGDKKLSTGTLDYLDLGMLLFAKLLCSDRHSSVSIVPGFPLLCNGRVAFKVDDPIRGAAR